MRLVPLLALMLLTTTGCRSEAVVAEPTPARLAAPDAQTRAELQRVVSAALGGVEVTLSEQALTDSSLLIIERRRHVDPSGRRIMGRDMGTSDRFMLLKVGEECLLEHQGSGERWALAGAVCVRAPVEPTQQP
jgi:hypothetical protein